MVSPANTSSQGRTIETPTRDPTGHHDLQGLGYCGLHHHRVCTW